MWELLRRARGKSAEEQADASHRTATAAEPVPPLRDGEHGAQTPAEIRTRMRGLRPSDVVSARSLLAARAEMSTLQGARLDELIRTGSAHREFSITERGGVLRTVAWHGVSLSLVGEADDGDLAEVGKLVRRRRQRFSSIVGERELVGALWPYVEPILGQPREQRWSQPILAARHRPAVAAHPDLRCALPREAGLIYPASVAMFRAEVGTDPERADGGRAYRARVAELARSGRTYVIRSGETIIFKADVGAVFADVAQIHGVWVDPRYRRQGIGGAAMAAVAEQVKHDHAPSVTLYVNDFNVPARATYARAGFTQVGELSTLLM